MKVLLALVMVAPLLAGCSEKSQEADSVVPEGLSFTIRDLSADVGQCGGHSRDNIGILVVNVRNDGKSSVDGSDYDFKGYDWSDLDYPFCPVDEPVIAPGTSVDVVLHYFRPTEKQEPCVALKDVELLWLQDGSWRTSPRQPSGLPDPCPRA